MLVYSSVVRASDYYYTQDPGFKSPNFQDPFNDSADVNFSVSYVHLSVKVQSSCTCNCMLAVYVTQAGDRSLANVIAHELSHSWTGNLVTNENWEEFW